MREGRPRDLRLLAAVAAVVAIGLTGCRGPAAARVTVRSFEFRPAEVHVEPGERVTWTNEDNILHTVTSGAAGAQGVPGVSEEVPASPDGRFDLELDGKGSTASFDFGDPGSYPYFCVIHSGMSGTIEVE